LWSSCVHKLLEILLVSTSIYYPNPIQTAIFSLFSAFNDNPLDLSEEEKIVRNAQANTQHFEKIYDIYFEKIFIYIHRRVKDEEIADDLTSQTFYKAMCKIHTFKYVGFSISSWLFKIATNELNMFFRKEKDAVRHVSIFSDGANNIFDFEDENEADKHEKLEALSQAIKQLKADEIQLIEWRFFEERSFKEIGYIIEISEDNAKVRTYRVLQKLRNLLAHLK
jgi:RNA polymerase sigma-70 factor (ECF subfamily)